MIDLAVLRQDPDVLKSSQAARGESVELVDQVIAADIARRGAVGEFEALRTTQKAIGAKVAKAQGEEKTALLAETKTLSEKVKTAENSLREMDAVLDALVLGLSNVVDPAAPVGGEDDFVVLKEVGTKRDFATEGISVRDHVEIGELLGAIDIERGAKVSGSRFYYLTGPGAMLELALVQLAMNTAQKNGFTPMIPPALVKPAAMEGTGFLGQAAENVYRLEADDLYLVGTAEVPLAAYHMDEILEGDLPRRYAAFSPCFRREAGSHGKDTRGIFRVHWFDKVEMFSFCPVDEALDEHARLLGFEEEFLQLLEIPYRVIDVATGDLGSSAARKFDCEAWVPSQERYREVTSTSNCTTFQARRLKIRSRGENGVEPIATLNGTLCAVTRTIVALFENHQEADGSVRIPKALQPYLGGASHFKVK
ncbi:MAG: serine--tRNA ligase [Candidatus Nanopelagicales bacterium]|jgi:seryl-tRNA synthetase|nr:serine--tRNA ligase [Candidatus Nanopelagicales bacterium]MDP4666738.1 serine--tRNA ligase [Candidatus Nanopelagicales bacterium]MDP4895935.1 serine--tRNA ligase [Candidatus Nanopelagicales bacterium]MDP5050353.1 serine--tRNA ligase [Candidatus Nanopelagicales bacterium]